MGKPVAGDISLEHGPRTAQRLESQHLAREPHELCSHRGMQPNVGAHVDESHAGSKLSLDGAQNLFLENATVINVAADVRVGIVRKAQPVALERSRDLARLDGWRVDP